MCHILRVRVPKDIGAIQLVTLARVKEIQMNFPSNLSELDDGTTCIFVIPVHKYLSTIQIPLYNCPAAACSYELRRNGAGGDPAMERKYEKIWLKEEGRGRGRRDERLLCYSPKISHARCTSLVITTLYINSDSGLYARRA